jgi:PfaB family protein
MSGYSSENLKASGEIYLFPLAAPGQAGLNNRLEKLRQALESGPALAGLARQYYADFEREKAFPYSLALVGRSKAELQRESAKAAAALADAFATGQPWHSPAGSYFTPQPLGERGEVAFVYPGAFNSYAGLGRELFERFPDLYQRFSRKCANPGLVLAEPLLGWRSGQPLTRPESERLEARLAADPTAMMLSGAGFATLFTMLMRQDFGLQPSAAFGYSLGESSMLWALEAWQGIDRGLESLSRSPLFHTRLAGPKETIREQWQIPAAQPDEAFWSTYFVLTPVERLKEALRREERVYLTHINTPEEAVISGDSAACRRLIEGLNCHYLRRAPSSVLHCEPARAEYAGFLKIHSYPTRPAPSLRFYSAADYGLLKMEQTGVAAKLSDMACQPVDFPRLVEQVYRDGARLFVELGPGYTCTRWVNRILKDKDHLAANICQKGVGEPVSLVRLLAKLVSHRVPLNLAKLYAEDENLPAYARPVVARNLARLQANAAGLAGVQANFLGGRQQGLGQLREMLGRRMALIGQTVPTAPALTTAGHQPGPASLPEKTQPVSPARQSRPPALFDERQIEEFATGSVTACFGPRFAGCEGRRVPRIPNGDLKLLSRITAITETGPAFEGLSSLTAEYDVPAAPWFYAENAYPFNPYSIFMEMALQPCGFLAAYKGSFLLFPGKDLYFRNLDGQATLLREVDLRGKTVTTQARLLSTAVFEETIIQRFDFECACEGAVFYRGSSAFGFFTKEAMLKQVGLDSGKAVLPWLEHTNQSAARQALTSPAGRSRYYQPSSPARPHYRLSNGRLDLLDEVVLLPGEGRYGQGYIYATRKVNPADWFYKCHFYQDAVMPGSLGLEAILQAMQVFAIEQNLGRHLKSPRFRLLFDHNLAWKYRGQITPDNRQMSLEIHLNRVEIQDKQVILTGEASLWKDGLRIYEVKQVGLALSEAAPANW